MKVVQCLFGLWGNLHSQEFHNLYFLPPNNRNIEHLFCISFICCQIIKRSKSKVSPVHSIRAYRRNRGITPLILNLNSRWRSVANFAPRLLCLLERNAEHIDKQLDRPQGQSGSHREDRNLFVLSGLELRLVHSEA
jgi:hypothetical protein